jgi:hypothetical protein
MFRQTIAGAIIFALPFSAAAQTAPAPPSDQQAAVAAPFDDLVGWYDVTATVRPGSCRLKSDLGGEWRAKTEAVAGRRGLVLHLEQLGTYFSQPVLLKVDSNGAFVSHETMPLDLGLIKAPATVDLRGTVASSRRDFTAEFGVRNGFCALSGTLSGTRTDPPPPPPAGEVTGASLNSDGSITPPASPVEPAVTDPMMRGTFAGQVTIRNQGCIRPVAGSFPFQVDVRDVPVVVIPLQNYDDIFAGPLELKINGKSLTQPALVPLRIGPSISDYKVQAVGTFSDDYQSLRLTVDVDAAFCKLTVEIDGAKRP